MQEEYYGLHEEAGSKISILVQYLRSVDTVYLMSVHWRLVSTMSAVYVRSSFSSDSLVWLGLIVNLILFLVITCVSLESFNSLLGT